MTTETETQPGALISDAAAAARRLCHEKCPDLSFALYMMPREHRTPLLVGWALIDQLNQVLFSSDEEGGCCGEGGSPAQRRRGVCSAIIAHLFAGEPTGKPELDGFAPLATQLGLSPIPFEQYCDGVAASLVRPRIATWKRFREQTETTAGVLARLAFQVAVSPEIDDTKQHQLTAWADALRLIDELCRLGETWRTHQRIVLPLDDLIKFRLSDRDIAQFAERATCDNDERFKAFIAFEVDRINTLLDGGTKAWQTASGAARRAVALFEEGFRRKVQQLTDNADIALSKPATVGMTGRIGQLFGAIRHGA